MWSNGRVFEPLFLKPILAPKPWGGRRLSAYGKPVPTDANIGESWDVVDLDPAAASTVANAQSVVQSGRFDGMTLHDLVVAYPTEILGAGNERTRFPLLVKWIDARENLSIQLHPSETGARPEAGVFSKTESWYVVEALDDARLLIDVVAATDHKDVVEALGSQKMVGLMRQVLARRGGFHHIPAGMLHALGAGVLILEVQTPSDTTFRVYDWAQEYGRETRPMHVDQAGPSLVLHHPSRLDRDPLETQGSRLLVETQAYSMTEHRGIPLALDDGVMTILCVVAGEMRSDKQLLVAGTTLLVPAAASRGIEYLLEADSVVVEITANSGRG